MTPFKAADEAPSVPGAWRSSSGNAHERLFVLSTEVWQGPHQPLPSELNCIEGAAYLLHDVAPHLSANGVSASNEVVIVQWSSALVGQLRKNGISPLRRSWSADPGTYADYFDLTVERDHNTATTLVAR